MIVQMQIVQMFVALMILIFPPGITKLGASAGCLQMYCVKARNISPEATASEKCRRVLRMQNARLDCAPKSRHYSRDGDIGLNRRASYNREGSNPLLRIANRGVEKDAEKAGEYISGAC